jgi:hypothetical protein
MAKVKVTNADVLAISSALGYLNQKETEAWYQIAKNTKKLKAALDDINESKKLVFEKYAEKDEKGEIKFKDQNKTQIDFGKNEKEADEMWKKIQEEEIEIDFHTFSSNVLAGQKLNSTIITPLIDIIIVD